MRAYFSALHHSCSWSIELQSSVSFFFKWHYWSKRSGLLLVQKFQSLSYIDRLGSGLRFSEQFIPRRHWALRRHYLRYTWIIQRLESTRHSRRTANPLHHRTYHSSFFSQMQLIHEALSRCIFCKKRLKVKGLIGVAPLINSMRGISSRRLSCWRSRRCECLAIWPVSVSHYKIKIAPFKREGASGRRSHTSCIFKSSLTL